MVTPQEIESCNRLSPEPNNKMTRKASQQIDTSSDKYPYCIVWSPLPVITWFLPFIGHTGIGNSEGVLVIIDN